jgi:superfamily I DNA and/or RNA helicase
VGVISFYRGQVELISRLALSAFSGDRPLHFKLDVNTVDAYQGSERDVVILSCVRTLSPPSPVAQIIDVTDSATSSRAGSGMCDAPVVSSSASSAIGFVDDTRRINVALTRAKYSCWILGSSFALQTSATWSAFIHHCSLQGCRIRIVDPADIDRFLRPAPRESSLESGSV